VLLRIGLNYGVGVAMTVARAEWGKVPIPGEKGAITEPILGTLTYDVNNITLAPNPILPDPVISFVPSVGVLLHLCVPLSVSCAFVAAAALQQTSSDACMCCGL
jgi:hypothetical protein